MNHESTAMMQKQRRVISMEVAWFSIPEEGMAKLQQDQNRVNYFLIGKVPTLKGAEVSLSYVQCFLYLLSSSINVSIFHSIWLDTFWTDLMESYMNEVVVDQV